MKKIFLDIYMAFNLGDDLFLDILLKKFPDTEFIVNYMGTDYNQFLKNYKNAKKRPYNFIDKILRKVKVYDKIQDYDTLSQSCDAMVLLGGSIFREESFAKEVYKERFKIFSAFNARKKPIYILGANFGPYETEEFYSDYKQLFRLCEDICFRDKNSYRLFSDLPNVRFAPDIVYQMEGWKNKSKKNEVGFSIIDLDHKHQMKKFKELYEQMHLECICKFLERGYSCWLMSFCKSEGDLDVINRIRSKVPSVFKDNVHVFDYDGNLEEALNCISQFKVFYAARFHANILAQLLDLNYVPIIYSSKTSNVLEDMGISNYITMENLKKLCEDDYIINGGEYKEIINTYRAGASSHFEGLKKFIYHHE